MLIFKPSNDYFSIFVSLQSHSAFLKISIDIDSIYIWHRSNWHLILMGYYINFLWSKSNIVYQFQHVCYHVKTNSLKARQIKKWRTGHIFLKIYQNHRLQIFLFQTPIINDYNTDSIFIHNDLTYYNLEVAIKYVPFRRSNKTQ